MKLEDKLLRFKAKGFTYNQITGDIITPNGKISKSIDSNGYKRCYIWDKQLKKDLMVKNHQLAWFLFYNEVPNVIDHINGDRSDNSIKNLRDVKTIAKNAQTKHFMNCKKIKGYHYNKINKKWIAQIQSNSVKIYLGSFDNIQDAESVYKLAKLRYHT